jgi:heptosyltransferase-2
VLGIGWDACRARRVVLRPPEDDRDGAGRHLAGLSDRLVALLPGAARGPSKRWPAEAFAQVGRELGRRAGGGVLVLGGPGEEDLGRAVAEAAGPRAVNLCGRLSLGESVAVLARCALAVTNDSGGMHLAAAAGIRVVAVFGLTDPQRTGPLGDGHRIIRPEGVRGARDIGPDSAAAREALAGIRPERVTEAAVAVMEEA